MADHHIDDTISQSNITHEEETDESSDFDYEDDHIALSTSPQVVSGVNVRNFMEEHLGGFVRQYTTNQDFAPMNVLIVPTGSRGASRLIPISEYEANLMLAEQMGKVEVGVKNIDDVSQFVPICVDEKNPDEICSICREVLGGDDENNGGLARKLLCGHTFCDDCITMWLKKHKTCPLCMADQEELLHKNDDNPLPTS